ncbi:hypothetical protein F4802DRAFT_542794 [Xylaria palmicola]|nr:hypothetical protein F4802DRAFT_542794 [Xylaria palmicola]
MFSRILTISGLLVASLLTPCEAKTMSAIRFSTRADGYIWTVTWTGPKTCTSWPCSYSYEVSAPAYTAAGGSIPFFDATCQGTVDQLLASCSLLSTQAAGAAPVTVSGNFSTFETSGVGSGLIDITASWLDQASGMGRTLTGVTPLQATATNHNTWTVQPQGCPLTDCAAANATRSPRRGTLGLLI